MIWLPFASMTMSIEPLDNDQLDDAWTTAYNALRANLGCRNAPSDQVVKLWRGSETALANYAVQVMREQKLRQPRREIFTHDLFWAIVEDGPRILSGKVIIELEMLDVSPRGLKSHGFLPNWFGWRPLHESHRKAMFTGDMSSLVWPWRTDGKIRTVAFQGRQGSGPFRP